MGRREADVDRDGAEAEATSFAGAAVFGAGAASGLRSGSVGPGDDRIGVGLVRRRCRAPGLRSGAVGPGDDRIGVGLLLPPCRAPGFRSGAVGSGRCLPFAVHRVPPRPGAPGLRSGAVASGDDLQTGVGLAVVGVGDLAFRVFLRLVCRDRAFAHDRARVLHAFDALVGGLADQVVARPVRELGPDDDRRIHPACLAQVALAIRRRIERGCIANESCRVARGARAACSCRSRCPRGRRSGGGRPRTFPTRTAPSSVAAALARQVTRRRRAPAPVGP